MSENRQRQVIPPRHSMSHIVTDFGRSLSLAGRTRVAGLTCRCGRPAARGAVRWPRAARRATGGGASALVAHACEKCPLVVDGEIVFTLGDPSVSP